MKQFFKIKVVPRFFALCGEELFLFKNSGGDRLLSGLKSLDVLSLLLVAAGSIMVYGVNSIFKLFKIKSSNNKILVFKLIGLVIAGVGFLRIFDVI